MAYLKDIEQAVYEADSAPNCTPTIPEAAVQNALDAFEKTATTRDGVIAALTAALPFLTGVTVKKLEWTEETYSVEDSEVIGWTADTKFATYYHIKIKSDGFRVYTDGTMIGVFSSEEAAKAAAQAYYAARILSAVEATETIETYYARQIEWSKKTFGPALRTLGILEHIRKELKEIEAEPHDLSEWIDVVILAMDGFWRHGGSVNDLMPLLLAKQTKNMARDWPDWRTMSENSAIEHDRSKDDEPSPRVQALEEGDLADLRNLINYAKKIGHKSFPSMSIFDDFVLSVEGAEKIFHTLSQGTSSERAQALEDTGNPVNYDHAEAMQVLAKCACKVCGGTGERNDADCGDMYLNTWVCDGCDGQGWDRQAYFEAFPEIRALSHPVSPDMGVERPVEGGCSNLEHFWRPISEADKSITFNQDFDLGDGEKMTVRSSDDYWVRDDDGRVYQATWTDHKGGYWWDIEGESPVDPVEFMPHPLSRHKAPGGAV
ncbi:dATP/dGTP pyrophosphohydrolase domain-containing protein [Ochrobactrum sp. Marseille-Q0166]|uniref:dATP/dGTP pyrophosphohydrolase domain-containing protein n=1 Tax=Ochrobactrum sp. Marseille-Q0166 TaxID=2761105 RepID=UPI001FFF0B7D|nr:dATP/dGTP pyrophosphohydrolase domain-containing protein [Ochrobactrum sp. Marseille-Q0166]